MIAADLTIEARLARIEAMLGLARHANRMPGQIVPRRQLIVEAAATHWLCRADDITGPSRERWLVQARSAIVWALRQGPQPFSYPRIGKLLGGRDNSTCRNLHSIARRLRLTNPGFRAASDQLAAIAALPAPFIERPHS
jgi:chromosomal replication initiation ATPase DnaA